MGSRLLTVTAQSHHNWARTLRYSTQPPEQAHHSSQHSAAQNCKWHQLPLSATAVSKCCLSLQVRNGNWANHIFTDTGVGVPTSSWCTYSDNCGLKLHHLHRLLMLLSCCDSLSHWWATDLWFLTQWFLNNLATELKKGPLRCSGIDSSALLSASQSAGRASRPQKGNWAFWVVLVHGLRQRRTRSNE